MLALVIGFGCLTQAYMPEMLQQALYAISLTTKEVLLFLLPFIVFSLLFGSIVNIKNSAIKIILALIPLLTISNFIATSFALWFGNFFIVKSSLVFTLINTSKSLSPLWELSLPKLVPNDIAMFSGIILGIIFSYQAVKFGEQLAKKLNIFAVFILKKLLVPVMPIFVLGFIIRMVHDGLLVPLIKNYALVFLLIFSAQLFYVFLAYGLGAKFSSSRWYHNVKHMLPAALTGFSTMSSAAAMPITLLATEKNTGDHELSRLVIPTTVNIHLMGDCIAIPILAVSILASYGAIVDAQQFMLFAGYFVLAKFAVAAVPAGGILVMLPILEKYLHFSPDMLSLITALYIMFDPIITSINVLGNGAFATIFKRIVK
jgi:Na+/H+-dicarboxylate symporter